MNSLLLDTCALIWLSLGGGKLTKQALRLIDDAQMVSISTISAFEISHKYAKGGIELPCDPERWFYEVLKFHDIAEIAVDSQIAISSTKLPFIHSDPCDRFIIATAMRRGLPIVTADDRFTEYGVKVIR